MTVIDLAARRAGRPTTRQPATRDYCCPRHVLDELAARTAQRLASSNALLVPRTDLEAVLADLQATVDRLLPMPHPDADAPHHVGGHDA